MQFLKNPAVLVVIIVVCIVFAGFSLMGTGGRPGIIKEKSTYDEHTINLWADENAEQRLDYFLSLTKNPIMWKSMKAVENIEKMGAFAERAIPDLKELSDHPNEQLRGMAAKAISTIEDAVKAKAADE